MATPVATRPTNKQFLGNRSSSKMEVHDLKQESVQCQINEIVRAGHAVTFSPDTLAQAHSEGYDNGAYCIGNSRR